MTEKSADPSKWQLLFIKRYFRLMFPCAAVLIVYMILWKIGVLNNNALANTIGVDWLRSESPMHWKGFLQSVIFSPIGGGTQYLNILWMMRYILFVPFFVVLLRFLFNNTVLFFKLFVVGVLACMNIFYINIIWGFVLVDFKEKYRNNTIFIKYRVFIIIVLVLFLAFTIAWFLNNPSRIKDVARIIESCALVSIIYLCSMKSHLPTHTMRYRSICRRIMRWLGEISFEVYLLHLIVLYAVTCNIYPIVPTSIQENYWVWCVITLGITIPLAYLWKRFVNKYINILVEKISKAIITEFYVPKVKA